MSRDDVSDEWLFDLGNTRLKWARLREDGVDESHAHAHGGNDAGLAALALPRGTVAHVASVASPTLTVALLERLVQIGFGRIQIARTQARCGDVRIAYTEPARLGVDRFLALLAAHRRAPAATLIVAVGTALTLDLIDDEGLHRGGRIAPSPSLMREALHARAAQLPATGGGYAEFARDTDDALASGCEGAALALVERSMVQARELLGTTPALLLHGGGATALQSRLTQAQPAPGLVLEGLAHWARLES